MYSLEIRFLLGIIVKYNVSIYDNVTLDEGDFCGPGMVFTNVYNPRSLIERKNQYRMLT